MTEPAPQLRYAVLHHTRIADEHFDLLIETSPDAPLATWRCDNWPPPRESRVTRLPDHRRIYLDYEGPVSGGRGEVHRVEAGACTIRQHTPSHLLVQLSHPARQLTLTQLRDQRWSLHCAGLQET